MKRFSVEGVFPEVKAHHYSQLCAVKAGSWEEAAKLGMKELRSRPGLKGKRIETIQLTIRLIEERPDQPLEGEA